MFFKVKNCGIHPDFPLVDDALTVGVDVFDSSIVMMWPLELDYGVDQGKDEADFPSRSHTTVL